MFKDDEENTTYRCSDEESSGDDSGSDPGDSSEDDSGPDSDDYSHDSDAE